MKKLLALIALGFSLTGFGQLLDGYKYVLVPKIYNNNSDIYEIPEMIQKFFLDKGLIVLTETNNLSEELKKNPCLILLCQMNFATVYPNESKVTITLRNCKLDPVYSNTGIASAWAAASDFKKAAKKAFNKLEKMTWNFDSTKTPHFDFPPVEQTNETEESIRTYLTNNKLDSIEGIYKSFQADQDISSYKIGIIRKGNQYKAIVLESDVNQWKPGEVKGIFEQTSVKGLYSVKWFLNNKTPFETFGNMENEVLLSIAFKNQKTGETSQNKFIKMFPQVSGAEITFAKGDYKASGSGFFLTTDGIIGTNAHLLNNVNHIEISISNEIGNFTYKAKAILVDSKNDVALIKIDDSLFKGLSSIPYGISEKADIGEKVFTIGYPLETVMGANYKVNDGIISAKTGMADDVRYYQISIPLQPGNSGGPLFDKSGNIIGITSSGLKSKGNAPQVENVNYAIKSSYLMSLYNMLPDSKPIPTSATLDNKELQDQVKVLKNYVCLIKVY